MALRAAGAACGRDGFPHLRPLQRHVHALAKKCTTLVTCHDLLAVRSALGEIPQNPTGGTGKLLQKMDSFKPEWLRAHCRDFSRNCK